MRERVEIEETTGREDEDAAAAEEEELRRARLVKRVVGPEDDEGAAEEASARFRLRVSIQKPKPLKSRIGSPTDQRRRRSICPRSSKP